MKGEIIVISHQGVDIEVLIKDVATCAVASGTDSYASYTVYVGVDRSGTVHSIQPYQMLRMILSPQDIAKFEHESK